MGNVLEGLKPESVFKNFEKISQIPRGSGNEKGISDFLLSFGKNLGLETIQDESL
ncbi:aminoacyl-histidine dipeptidase, partial [Clostridioides difficile]|nr:aminoacyl-histidine dipeptidase [Clostridioides difficile]